MIENNSNYEIILFAFIIISCFNQLIRNSSIINLIIITAYQLFHDFSKDVHNQLPSDF